MGEVVKFLPGTKPKVGNTVKVWSNPIRCGTITGIEIRERKRADGTLYDREVVILKEFDLPSDVFHRFDFYFDEFKVEFL